MSSIFDKIKKRAAYPCKLPNGEQVLVRNLTNREVDDASSIEDTDTRAYYWIGSGLLNDDHSQAFDKQPENEGFAASVKEATKDWPRDSLHAILEMIIRITQAPTEKASEAIIKN